MPGEPYWLKLKPNAEAVHARPFPVPQKHLKLMKDELNHLIELGLLPQANESEWAAPSLGIPKIYNTICFVSDLQVSTCCETSFPSAKHSRDHLNNGKVYLLYNSGYEHGLLDYSHLSRIAENLYYYPTMGKFSYTCLRMGCAITRFLPREDVPPVH